MHDVACEFARAAVRSKDAQKQLARTSLSFCSKLIWHQSAMWMIRWPWKSFAMQARTVLERVEVQIA